MPDNHSGILKISEGDQTITFDTKDELIDTLLGYLTDEFVTYEVEYAQQIHTPECETLPKFELQYCVTHDMRFGIPLEEY